MATKAVGEYKILDLVMRAYDGVAIEHVVVIVPGPKTLQTDSLKLRNAMCHGGPDQFLELIMSDVEIIGSHLDIVLGHTTREEICTFGAAKHTGRINHIRHAPMDRRGTAEYEDTTTPEFDRDLEPYFASQGRAI